MSMTDDWQTVGQQDDWQSVAPQPQESERVPQPFIERVMRGEAIKRVFDKAVAGAREGYGTPTPTGFSDETLQQLIDLGIFHDPLRGRPSPVQLVHESVLQPLAQGWQMLTGAINAGVHATGGIIGALHQGIREYEGSQNAETEGEQARRETINVLNWGLIESGFGRFSRPSVGRAGAAEHEIGPLPRDVDFKTAAEVLKPDEPATVEANLHRAWHEDGIHPAEAVHDAQRDAFARHDITTEPTVARIPVDDAVLLEQAGMIPRALAEDALPPVPEGYVRFYHGGREPGSGGGRWVTTDPEYARNFRSGGSPNELHYVDIPKGDPWEIKARAWDEALDAGTNMVGRYNHIELPEHWAQQLKPADGAPLRAVGAEVTTEPPPVPLSEQPAPRAGALAAYAHDAASALLDMGRDAQMLVAPMARGTRDSMAMAKDFANTTRRNRWEWSRIDADIEKRFTAEQRARMWNAADEESVARQLGESREHQGLVTLTGEERAAVEDLQARAQNAWLRARDLGMVEGEGLPAYTPRMVMNAALANAGDSAIPLNGIGLNLRTRSPGMRHRAHMTVEETEAAAKAKYGNDAYVARDIRALPLATAHLEDAVAGRTLINNIKDYGARAGTETVVEGAIPAGTETKFFTIDHPAFRTWRPKFKEKEGGGVEVVKDAEGNTIFEQVPIYVHGDFEGPLRAVLTQRSGPMYGAMMSLKGKTMSLIMNSPMIHNAVEWGRALPAMPGKVATFKVYFEGNRVKNDVTQMREAIDAGLVPIGKRFFNQDITSIMEAPDLAPGRSWTAKLLGAVPGLFDEAAGVAVKRAIDKAGDFWHNTLLWDRIADLQMGLYANFREEMLAKGIDRQTANRVAAHWANRYAGALPQEAMSDAARKVANVLLFSRSFTLGNLGVMKDMLTGLPKDVIAQIERDAGFGKGSIEGALPEQAAEGVKYAKTLARRKAIAVVLADVALMYVGNSILQSVINVIRTDRTVDQEMKGYADRFAAAMEHVKEHPLALIQPFDFMERLSSTSENEPGKADRIRIGTAKDGTAIYMRNPAGKIGEEFVGYMNGPLDMLRRKLGTVARPGWQILANDKGFGRKVYDPNADVPEKYLLNIGRIAMHLAASQVPEGQMSAAMDLVKGDGDPAVNTAQAFGPIAGVTFSRGAPGGPAVGELYKARERHDFDVQRDLPDIRKMVQRGDIAGAQDRLTALGVPPGLQRFYIKTSLFPETRLGGRTLRDFYLYATPEQRERMERARQPQ
jgi:hypothetical protein